MLFKCLCRQFLELNSTLYSLECHLFILNQGTANRDSQVKSSPPLVLVNKVIGTQLHPQVYVLSMTAVTGKGQS